MPPPNPKRPGSCYLDGEEDALRDKRKNSPAQRVVTLAAALAAAMVLVAGCAAGGERSEGARSPTTPEDTPGITSEETSSGEESMLEIRPMDSGSSGQGAARPNAVVAASSESLSAATGIQSLRGAESTTAEGEEVYVAVLWGEKNTGGYAVEIEGASLEGERVEISLALQSPPEGAIVSQAFTYPYAVAAIGGLDPAGKDFVITDQSGRELGWPVETA